MQIQGVPKNVSWDVLLNGNTRNLMKNPSNKKNMKINMRMIESLNRVLKFSEKNAIYEVRIYIILSQFMNRVFKFIQNFRKAHSKY